MQYKLFLMFLLLCRDVLVYIWSSDQIFVFYVLLPRLGLIPPKLDYNYYSRRVMLYNIYAETKMFLYNYYQFIR